MLNISLRAETLFYIGSFPVTNALLLSTVALALIAAMAFTLRRQLAVVPRGFQNVVEIVIEGALGLMDSVLGNRRMSEKYLPLVFTVFIFIMISNWLGLFPGVGSLVLNQHGDAVPLFRSPASDLNFTLALALIAVTLVNVIGAATLGLRARLSVFFNFKGPIDFFVGILELIGEFAKIISFSFRLFGNVFAGEVLLAIMAFLVPYAVPLPFMLLEIFVGFIQAFIFAMLTLVFVAMAIAEHGDGEGYEAEHEKVAVA
ncbi:MAG TPA: F0F1 ATP synthase subunit A [Candidatus Paceibacterota bacterium]|nr:F0F1 ATP synthase subunit A [Candidatus Paceibacterota bacterium]